MTPGNHNARRLALTDARLVPLDWLSVMQIEDTECPPHPSGIVQLAQPTVPERRVPPPPRVVRHQRRTALGAALLWIVERIPAAIVLLVIGGMVVWALREATL